MNYKILWFIKRGVEYEHKKVVPKLEVPGNLMELPVELSIISSFNTEDCELSSLMTTKLT